MTRVLVVEDEESYADALSYMLRKEGYDVSLAATGPASRTPGVPSSGGASPPRRSTARTLAISSRAE